MCNDSKFYRILKIISIMFMSSIVSLRLPLSLNLKKSSTQHENEVALLREREVGVEVQEWESPCGEDAPPLVSDCL